MFGNTIKELFVCLLALTITVNAFRRQSTAVKGRLLCASEPAAEVLVKLFDQDDGRFFVYYYYIFYLKVIWVEKRILLFFRSGPRRLA